MGLWLCEAWRDGGAYWFVPPQSPAGPNEDDELQVLKMDAGRRNEMAAYAAEQPQITTHLITSTDCPYDIKT
jgi:hypothetical protein